MNESLRENFKRYLTNKSVGWGRACALWSALCGCRGVFFVRLLALACSLLFCRPPCFLLFCSFSAHFLLIFFWYDCGVGGSCSLAFLGGVLWLFVVVWFVLPFVLLLVLPVLSVVSGRVLPLPRFWGPVFFCWFLFRPCVLRGSRVRRRSWPRSFPFVLPLVGFFLRCRAGCLAPPLPVLAAVARVLPGRGVCWFACWLSASLSGRPSGRFFP